MSFSGRDQTADISLQKAQPLGILLIKIGYSFGLIATDKLEGMNPSF